MDYQKYRQAQKIEEKYKERLLKVNPLLDEGSGIYALTRNGEDGLRYAYIGQAKQILSRLAQHMNSRRQHIDRSLKKHGLYDAENNPHGWVVNGHYCPKDMLDEKEKFWIRSYADLGYQLLNKTAGGQGEGKTQIAEFKPAKGYRDGLARGRKSLARELSHIAEKHLEIRLKPEKQGNKVSQRQYERFLRLMKGEDTT